MTATITNGGIILTDSDGSLATVTPFGRLATTDPVRLAGQTFEVNGALNSNQWTTTTANSATATVSDGLLTIATLTTANGSAQVLSSKKGRHLAGNSNRCAIALRVNNTGVANNVRRWGVFNVSSGTTISNGYYFILNGTSFGIGYSKAGSETIVTSLNGDAFTLDTNDHRWRIDYNTEYAYFYVDDMLVHTLRDATTSTTGEYSLKIGMHSINSGGITSNNTLLVRAASILRFGPEVSRPLAYYSDSAQTVTVKTGPGTLHDIIIGTKGLGSASLTIYDNTSATGTPFALIDVVNTLGSIHFDLDFDTGLTFVHTTTAGKITIVYD